MPDRDTPVAISGPVVFPSFECDTNGIDTALTKSASQPTPVRIRMPLGDECWLATKHSDVDRLYRDRAFSRSGLGVLEAPRMTSSVLINSGSFGGQSGPGLLRIRRATQRILRSDWANRALKAANDTAVKRIQQIAQREISDLVVDLSDEVPMSFIQQLLTIDGLTDECVKRYCAEVMMPAGQSGGLKTTAGTAEVYRRLLKSMQAGESGGGVLNAPFVRELCTESELIIVGMGLIVAGYETTANMLGKILLRIASKPEEFAVLRKAKISANTVDEFLRIVPLSRGDGIPWRVERECDLGGVQVRAGEYVVPSIATANTDSSVFINPQTIAFNRSNSRKHLSFGAGEHYCLGAEAARAQIASVLQALCLHLEQIEVQPPGPAWSDQHVLTSIISLPVKTKSPTTSDPATPRNQNVSARAREDKRDRG